MHAANEYACLSDFIIINMRLLQPLAIDSWRLAENGSEAGVQQKGGWAQTASAGEDCWGGQPAPGPAAPGSADYEL